MNDFTAFMRENDEKHYFGILFLIIYFIHYLSFISK